MPSKKNADKPSAAEYNAIRATTLTNVLDIKHNGYGFACLSPPICTEKYVPCADEALQFLRSVAADAATKCPEMLVFTIVSCGANEPDQESSLESVLVLVCGPSEVNGHELVKTILAATTETDTVNGVIYRHPCDEAFKKVSEVSARIFAAMKKTKLYVEEEEEDVYNMDF